MKDIINKIYSNPNFPIILGIIIAVLVVAFIVVYFIGKKDQKKNAGVQNSNQVPEFNPNNNVNAYNQTQVPQQNMQMDYNQNYYNQGYNQMNYNPQMMPNTNYQYPNMQAAPAAPTNDNNPNNMMYNQVEYAYPTNNYPEQASQVYNQNAYFDPNALNNQMNTNMGYQEVTPAATNETPAQAQVTPIAPVVEENPVPIYPSIENPMPEVSNVVENPINQPVEEIKPVESPILSNEQPSVDFDRINALADSIEKDLNSITAPTVENSVAVDDEDQTMAIELPKLKTEVSEVKPLLSDDTSNQLNI